MQFCRKGIYLFTDTADIFNLLYLGVLWDAKGALTQYLHTLFGKKENFTVYFLRKCDHYYIQRRQNDLFPICLKSACIYTERVYLILLMLPGQPIILLHQINSIWPLYLQKGLLRVFLGVAKSIICLLFFCCCCGYHLGCVLLGSTVSGWFGLVELLRVLLAKTFRLVWLLNFLNPHQTGLKQLKKHL